MRRGRRKVRVQVKLGIDIIIIIIILLEENYMAANQFKVCVSVFFLCACELFVYAGGVLKAPQAWKQRVKQ